MGSVVVAASLQGIHSTSNDTWAIAMERSLLNRSKSVGSQRLFVMPDSLEMKRVSQVTTHQKTLSLKRSTPIENKENVNPDTFELAQNESRQRRQRLPQMHDLNDDCNTHKPGDEISTPQDCKSRPPLRDITPIFQKVSAAQLSISTCSSIDVLPQNWCKSPRGVVEVASN